MFLCLSFVWGQTVSGFDLRFLDLHGWDFPFLSVPIVIPLSTCCVPDIQLILIDNTNCEQPYKFRILCFKHNKDINHVYHGLLTFFFRLPKDVNIIDKKKNWGADRIIRALQSLKKVPVHRAPGSRYPNGNSEHMVTTAEESLTSAIIKWSVQKDWATRTPTLSGCRFLCRVHSTFTKWNEESLLKGAHRVVKGKYRTYKVRLHHDLTCMVLL